MVSSKEKDILKAYIQEVSIEEMPTFPIDALPKMFQSFAKVKASNTNINVAAPATALLFVASFLAHGLTYTLRYSEGAELYSDSICTLWFSLFFESGKGKSESTEKWINYLFSQFQNELRQKFENDESSYNMVKDYNLYTSDSTVEAAIQAVGSEGSFAMYSEEIETIFRQLTDGKGNDKTSPLMSIWSGSAVKRLRVNSASKTKVNSRPNMPILAFGQPFSVSKLFEGNRIESGFFQRWLPVYDPSPVEYVSLSDRIKNKKKAGSAAEKKALKRLIESYKKGIENTFLEQDVLNPCKEGLHTDRDGFLLTELVHKVFTMKQIHFKSITTDYSAIYSKATEQFLRIACCLWVLDSIAEGSFWDKEKVLGFDILNRALKLTNYYVQNHILIQKQHKRELGLEKDIITIDNIVIKLANTQSYSINKIADMTGLSWHAVSKILKENNIEL